MTLSTNEPIINNKIKNVVDILKGNLMVIKVPMIVDV